DDEPVVDHWRAAEAPLVLAVDGEAGVDRAQVALPEQLPVEVVAVEPLRPEAGDDALAVGRRGAVRLTALEVPLDLRDALVGGAGPEDRARLAVEADHLPGVLADVVDRGDVAVVADAELRVGLAAVDRGRDEHTVAPHDRARVAQAGDRRLPSDVGAFL